MAANTDGPGSGKVSRWWRVIAFGLIAGVAVDVFARRQMSLPVVPGWPVSITPPPHDGRFFKTLPAMTFTNATFGQVVDWIGRQSGIAIQYDPRLSGGTTYDLKLEPGKVRDDLGVFLNAANSSPHDDHDLTVIDHGNSLSIVAGAEAVTTRIYDVRELLQEIIDDAPKAAPSANISLQNASQGTFGGGQQSQQQALPSDSDLVAADELKQLIISTIANETWKDNGGDIGTATYFAGFLIIQQTDENHRRIEAALVRIRRH